MNTVPTLELKALSVQDGRPQLVTRAIAIENETSIQEKMQVIKDVTEFIKEGEKAFPKGALIDFSSTADTKMNTWNAYLKVKM